MSRTNLISLQKMDMPQCSNASESTTAEEEAKNYAVLRSLKETLATKMTFLLSIVIMIHLMDKFKANKKHRYKKTSSNSQIEY